MDAKFEKIKYIVLDSIEVNTTGKNEHVGEIEQKSAMLRTNAKP